MKKILIISAILFVFIYTSCNTASDEEMKGKFNGKEWTLKTAKATQNQLDTNMFLIEFYDSELEDPCSMIDEGNLISTTCPRRVGKYDFGMLKFRFAYFNITKEPIMATDGYIEILSIDPKKNEIKGKIIAKYDSDNYVNGTFNAIICNEEPLEDIINELDKSLDTLMKNTDSVMN